LDRDGDTRRNRSGDIVAIAKNHIALEAVPTPPKAATSDCPDHDRHRAGWEWVDKGLVLLTAALVEAGTTGAELAHVAGEPLKCKD
jgi:hypothetical protein